jgi:hypothetical protein
MNSGFVARATPPFICLRKTIGILLTVGSVVCQLNAQTFLTNGLVGYYPFSGNPKDASGNGNNLTNFGATLCPDRFGNSNQAYYFNGSSYLGSSVSPLSQTDNWTVAAWMNPASLSQGYAYVACLGYDNGGASGENGYAFGLSANQLYAFFGGIGPFSGNYVFPTNNTWSHVVMLRSSGSTTFFVNGAMINGNISTTPKTPTAFTIGSASGLRYFNGAIDDVRVYNRALSASEVAQLYDYEAPPCIAHSATATATVTNGFVVALTLTDQGCGYTNTPLVQIVGGGGTGALAKAVVTNGQVISFTITDAGTGYTSIPAVFIGSPLGVQLGIVEAVIPTFQGLTYGSNYQLQSSSDLATWTNQGVAFTATNSSMVYTQYFNVMSWNQLYFRLNAAP